MIPNKSTQVEFGYRQIDLAVDILINNIEQIKNVSEWARKIGYSRAHFCRKFTLKFNENPKLVLRRARFRKICRVILSDWSATAFKVALEAGIQDEKALHKFLNRNFGLGFVALKDILKRDAFRSRNYKFRAAEDDHSYISISLNPLERTVFPGNFKNE